MIHRKPGKKRLSLQPASADGWMVTLSDMLLLLLTFFVLLISMSSFDRGMLENVFREFLPAGAALLAPGNSVNQDLTLKKLEKDPQINDMTRSRLDPELSRRLDQLAAGLGKALIRVEVVGEDLHLRCPSDYFFGALDDSLSGAGKVALGKIVDFLKGWSGDLQIEVHTDNFPLLAGKFHDNQALAAARGARLCQALATRGLADGRLLLAAWGSYRPLVANDSPDNRGRNRRIEFILPSWAELS